MTTRRYLRERHLYPRRALVSRKYTKWRRKLLLESFPFVCHEQPVSLGACDKVFSSLWLSECQVLCGTKCNQLLLYDTDVHRVIGIPTIPRPATFITQDTSPRSGMHSLARNPAGTVLASGGENINDVAFYSLPSMEPYTLGVGHEDWLFALAWLNDDIILSGSRDRRLLVWSMSNAQDCSVMEPVSSYCLSDDLVRDMALCAQKQEVALLSPNGRLRIMDINVMTKVHTVQAPAVTDNVCVTINSDQSMYAVGSSDCFLFADTCCGRWRRRVELPPDMQAVRSLTFRDHTLAIGCGTGEVLTYDIRNNQYLGGAKPITLVPRKGYMRSTDVQYQRHFINGHLNQAIYTLSYSKSGGQLFAAGGPLNAPFYGNFACVYR